MRIGSLVYATQQGLGYLAKSFYDAGVVTDVLVIAHSRKMQPWYPNADVVYSLNRPNDYQLARDFVRKLDCLLIFETPFYWDLIPYCREIGVKTVLMPMFECMPKKLPYIPDKFLCPSLLDLQYYPDRSTFIPVPVDGIQWRQREVAHTFVHNAGHGGLKGRNGTAELIQAIKHIRSPLNLIIRAQKEFSVPPSVKRAVDNRSVSFHWGNLDYDKLYTEGDVFVFPEKFNGLSLPLQEAKASGMAVMSSNRFPMNTWLNPEWLIPIQGYRASCVSGRCNDFQEAIIDPEAIAAKMDDMYDQPIYGESIAGRVWAEEHSWKNLKSEYLDYLAS